MIGLIFATQAEATPFLTLGRATALTQTPFDIYQMPTRPMVLTAVSGIGKVAAAVACQALIREYMVDEILNAGACGALQSGSAYAAGRLLCVTSAVEGDIDFLGSQPEPLISDGRLDWDLPAARLVTRDLPVFDIQQRKTLSATADLVDMEGAAIARVAAMYATPWTMVKGITDAAGPSDRATLRENLSLVSENISQLLWARLGQV